MSSISVKINGVEVKADPGTTILKAANSADIYIPALCAHPDLVPVPGRTGMREVYRGSERIETDLADVESKHYDGCRLCAVSVQGAAESVLACATPVSDGMVISTDTPELQAARKQSLSQILATHPHVCPTCAMHEGCAITSCSSGRDFWERCCSKNNNCEIQKVSAYIGIPANTPRYQNRNYPCVEDEPLFTYDWNLCTGCLRCVAACNEMQGYGALNFVLKNDEVFVGTVAPTLKKSGCTYCGACVEVCPTGAILDKTATRSKSRQELHARLHMPMMPPEAWLELTAKSVESVPASEGAYQLLDADKKIIFIAGTANMRQALLEVMKTGEPGSGKARYFVFEKDPMYTSKESELIQLFLSEHGRLPECNGIDDDLFD